MREKAFRRHQGELLNFKADIHESPLVQKWGRVGDCLVIDGVTVTVTVTVTVRTINKCFDLFCFPMDWDRDKLNIVSRPQEKNSF